MKPKAANRASRDKKRKRHVAAAVPFVRPSCQVNISTSMATTPRFEDRTTPLAKRLLSAGWVIRSGAIWKTTVIWHSRYLIAGMNWFRHGQSGIAIALVVQLGALVACGEDGGRMASGDGDGDASASASGDSDGDGDGSVPLPECERSIEDGYEWMMLCDAAFAPDMIVLQGCDHTWIESPFGDEQQVSVVRGTSSDLEYVEQRNAQGELTCASGRRPTCDSWDDVPPPAEATKPFIDFCYENGFTGSVEIEDECDPGLFFQWSSVCGSSPSVLAFRTGCGSIELTLGDHNVEQVYLVDEADDSILFFERRFPTVREGLPNSECADSGPPACDDWQTAASPADALDDECAQWFGGGGAGGSDP